MHEEVVYSWLAVLLLVALLVYGSYRTGLPWYGERMAALRNAMGWGAAFLVFGMVSFLVTVE